MSSEQKTNQGQHQDQHQVSINPPHLLSYEDIASAEDMKPFSELSCYGKIKRYSPQRPTPALGLTFLGSFFTWAVAEILEGRVDNGAVQIFVPLLIGMSSILPHAALARALKDYDSGCLSRIDDIEFLPQSKSDAMTMLFISSFLTTCLVEICKNSGDNFVRTFLPLLLGYTLSIFMQFLLVKTAMPCSQLMDGFKHDLKECCKSLGSRLPCFRSQVIQTPYPSSMLFSEKAATNPLTSGFDGYQESKSDDERTYEAPGSRRERSDAYGSNDDFAEGLTKSNSWQKKSGDDRELGGSEGVDL